MPRFHFNVHDSRNLQDEDGTDLPDILCARMEAIKFAGQMISVDAGNFAGDEDWGMDVTDDLGLILFRLDFSIVPSAAAKTLAGFG
jgi:hypothetical protein